VTRLGDNQRASISSTGMTLVWSPESIHDLLALRAYIAEHDPAAAKRIALHILYCVEHLLSETPKLGHAGRVPGTRELVTAKTPYILPYRLRGSSSLRRIRGARPFPTGANTCDETEATTRSGLCRRGRARRYPHLVRHGARIVLHIDPASDRARRAQNR
jgi:toxin ParE1/3/4